MEISHRGGHLAFWSYHLASLTAHLVFADAISYPCTDISYHADVYGIVRSEHLEHSNISDPVVGPACRFLELQTAFDNLSGRGVRDGEGLQQSNTYKEF